MTKKAFTIFMSFLFLFAMIGIASATYMADITYDYTDNGGGNYTFTFTVYNLSTDGSTGALDFFEIDFDADADNNYCNYSNITWDVDNGWLTDAGEPDPFFGGTPGYAMADDSVFGANGGGIVQGDSLGGFQVSFDYSGSLSPEQQLFSFYAAFGTSATDNGGIMIDDDGVPNSGDEYWILGEDSGNIRYQPAGPPPVPEPTTILLVGIGVIGLAGLGKKKSALKS